MLNGAGEGNRTLVIITKADSWGNPTPENQAKHRYLSPLLVKKNDSRPRSTFGNHPGRLMSGREFGVLLFRKSRREHRDGMAIWHHQP